MGSGEELVDVLTVEPMPAGRPADRPSGDGGEEPCVLSKVFRADPSPSETRAPAAPRLTGASSMRWPLSANGRVATAKPGGTVA